MPSDFFLQTRPITGRPVTAVLLAGAAALVAACASLPPPTELMAVTRAAVTHAATQGGHEAAPAEMRLARDKLERAQAAMRAEDYAAARRLATEAQVDAQLAEAKAQADKSKKAAAVVGDDSRALRQELDRKSSQ